MSDWRNRIVGTDVVNPKTLVPNEKNFRRHPNRQVAALEGSLDEIGWIAPVTVNRLTGRMLDGHARAELALRQGVSQVPVQYVELDEHEEALALATLDPIGAMATHDAGALDALLNEVNTGSAALQELLNEVAKATITPNDAEWASALGGLPNEDRQPFQQMTFTLHDDQAVEVKDALRMVMQVVDFADSPNGNSNGNALWYLCSEFLKVSGE